MIQKPTIEMIPIEKIRVLNSRSRSEKKFAAIVGSVSNLGLKKPITVSHRIENASDENFDLVCGQGRLEAYIQLGQKTIPAIVLSIPKEDRLLASLIENLARRSPTAMETVQHISMLKERGYTNEQIAKKIDVSKSHVGNIIRLLKNGEEGLLRAVFSGKIPVTIAIEISTASDYDIQKALAKAYEEKKLSGNKLMQVRRIVEQRQIYGKSLCWGQGNSKRHCSSEAMIKSYKQEVKRQEKLIKKSQLFETYLTFIVSALSQLFKEDRFVSLLKEESLDTLPSYLAEQLRR